MNLAVRYVAGLAALVSADLNCAEEMLRSVEAGLRETRHAKHPQMQKIRSKLPSWLLEINTHRINRLIALFIRNRDRTYLEEAEPVLANISAMGGGNAYSVCLCEAICRFVLHRDVAGARRALRKADPAVKKKDARWRFSEAFLHAYTGDLGKATAA
jgi:hypothetical protein